MLQTKFNRRTAGTIAVLFGWMVLNSSAVALAEQRCDNRRNQSRFSAQGTRRGAAYASAQRYRGYNQYQDYNRYRDSNRYRDYDRYRDDDRERSKTKSALIIAGSSGAGAAVGAIAAGGKGAAIGAIAGGVAGLVYDRHTDNR